MKHSTSSMLTVSVLAFSTMSAFADGQIRRRNGHGRILAEVAWGPQERVLEEPLIEDMEWVDFSMELSVELSMSMSMQHLSTKTKSTRGSMKSVVTTRGSDADGSIPEVPLVAAIDHKVLMKRNYVEDTHAAMKLVKT